MLLKEQKEVEVKTITGTELSQWILGIFAKQAQNYFKKYNIDNHIVGKKSEKKLSGNQKNGLNYCISKKMWGIFN